MALALAAALAGLDGDPRDDLAGVARLGFRCVQLSATRPGLRPRELDATGRRGLRERLRQLELSPSGVDLWIPPAHFVESAHIDRAVDAVIAAIELAADLGRVPVSVLLPARASDPAPGCGAFEEALAAMLRHGERFGVELVDHAVPPREAASGLDGRLRVGVDSAAWLAQGLDPAKAVAQHAARLGGARLSDLSIAGMRSPLVSSSSAASSSQPASSPSSPIVPGAAGRRAAAAPDGRLDALAYAVALHIARLARPVVADPRQWNDPWGGLAATRDAWMGLAQASG